MPAEGTTPLLSIEARAPAAAALRPAADAVTVALLGAEFRVGAADEGVGAGDAGDERRGHDGRDGYLETHWGASCV